MSKGPAGLWPAQSGGGPPSRGYVVADVFTDTPLQGNQLAVFTDGRGLPGEHMQRVARELNLSETVFFLPPEQGGDVRVRIFTPSTELPFAGHPVLGTAFVVGGLRSGSESISIATGMGIIPVAIERSGDKVTFGRMEQPVPEVTEYENTEALLDALGVAGSGLP